MVNTALSNDFGAEQGPLSEFSRCWHLARTDLLSETAL
jgi:hypothetical protein